MSNTLKEKIAEDLQKAKLEGGVRADRIRDIVQAAVSEAVSEIKIGSVEIRTIARDALAVVIDHLKDKGKTAGSDIQASVEGIVDGIKASREGAIAQTQTQVDHLQAQLDDHTQTLEAEVNGALMEIENTAQESSADFKSLLEAAIHAIRESRQFAAVQQEYLRLRAQLANLDTQLADRYGDRYQSIKQQLEKYWETAKVWYAKAKTEVPDPVQKMQVELGAKMAEARTAAAQKEQAARDHLKAMLKKDTQTEVSDAH